MDNIDEWEFLPDGGFLDYHDDAAKKTLSRDHASDPKALFNMNYSYFICPSPTSRPENSRVSNQLVPVPIQLDPTIEKTRDDELLKEITKVPIEISVLPAALSQEIIAPDMGPLEADQDTVSQVFFKKMKETEFVDMKMDSPKSGIRGILPQIDAGAFQFEDKGEAYKGEENKNSSKVKIEKEKVSKTGNLDSDVKGEITWEENSRGLNVWRWGMTGIGALCSIGVAAATICILILGGRQGNKHHHQNQKLRFEIYTDDKRIKQVVQHATKLNEAISAVRGVPLTSRAHITFGGYYDGL